MRRGFGSKISSYLKRLNGKNNQRTLKVSMEGYFPEGIWKTQTGFADSTGRADEADLQNLKKFLNR